MWQWLSGRKTYIIAVAAIIVAVVGYATGEFRRAEMIQTILAALGGMTIRSGITNEARRSRAGNPAKENIKDTDPFLRGKGPGERDRRLG